MKEDGVIDVKFPDRDTTCRGRGKLSPGIAYKHGVGYSQKSLVSEVLPQVAVVLVPVR